MSSGRALSLSLFALLAIESCKSSPSPEAPPLPSVPCDSTAAARAMDSFSLADVDVHVETGGDPALELVRADVARYLGAMWGGAIPTSTTTPDFSRRLTLWMSTSDAARARSGLTVDRGYGLARVDGPSGPIVVVTARDATSLATGTYALLEELGVRFFHPMQELVPALGAPRVPHTLSIARATPFDSRGVQMHTLHPIEYFRVLNEPGDANLADAKRLVDWLAKTGQNRLQWPLLSTVPFDAWVPHARAIVDYARARGVRVGCVLQLFGGSSLQNNFVLVSNVDKWQAEMDGQLDRAMTIDWDVVELALGEFVGSDPQSVIDWLSHAVDHLIAGHPKIEVDVQNHVGNYKQLYVQYRGKTEYLYHLARFADPRLGQSVHTLSIFDLYRDEATYKHPDFHFQHDYIVEQVATRRVSYFPESAYWISADIDVPLFLPTTIYARWNDVHTLTAELASKGLPPLAGHVTFSSGHEWLYWLTDYLTAKLLWDPSVDLDTLFASYAGAYGSCAPEIGKALGALTALQNRYVFDQRLFAYLQGENNTVDFGYLAGYETHPQRIAFETVLKMSAADRGDFEARVVAPLEAMAQEMAPIEDTIAARCRGADATIAPWCDELWDGVAITRQRALHSAHLYRAILDRAAGRDPEPDYAAALTTTTSAAAIVARREPHYRFDLARYVDAYDNPTVYGFGHLRPAHTLCYWDRQEQQVRYLLDNGGVPLGLTGLPSCQE